MANPIIDKFRVYCILTDGENRKNHYPVGHSHMETIKGSETERSGIYLKSFIKYCMRLFAAFWSMRKFMCQVQLAELENLMNRNEQQYYY